MAIAVKAAAMRLIDTRSLLCAQRIRTYSKIGPTRRLSLVVLQSVTAFEAFTGGLRAVNLIGLYQSRFNSVIFDRGALSFLLLANQVIHP
jgi:hypothetical protein